MDEIRYVIPCLFNQCDKPIKFVFDDVSVECNDDMTFTVTGKATWPEIADMIANMFDMTIDEVLNTKFGVFSINGGS